jgi:hypothetical protein
MFRLPQCSYHQAVRGIIKKKLFTTADTSILYHIILFLNSEIGGCTPDWYLQV